MPINHYISIIIVAVATIVAPTKATAFTADAYTHESALANGKWVKISVTESGLHFIPTATLHSWGFSDPARVSIHGYGATRLPDQLLQSTYVDDLPAIQCERTSRGIYFYAIGPVTLTPIRSQLTIETNPFTTAGYYYITENAEPSQDDAIKTTASTIDNLSTASSYTEIVYHKRELFNPGETGNNMLGEDFLTQPTQRFNFSLPGRIEDTQAWIECVFAAYNPNPTRIVLSVNDNALAYTSSDNIAETSEHYTHYIQATSRKLFEMTGASAAVTLTHSRTSPGNLARLIHIVLNYERKLELTRGTATFGLNNAGGRLSGGATPAETRVWDVTDPTNIVAMTTEADGNDAIIWNPISSGYRHYVAWQDGATLPTPTFVNAVTNQNLHGMETPDMVIFTHPDWRSQADRVAALHPELNVLVVEPQTLYNEFSSGAPDPNALRKLLKMFYDRSLAGDGNLQYALIMGRSVFDNRRITPTMAALSYPTLPGWQTDNSLSDNSSFTTDDIYAMLEDGAGASMKSDYNCIAVGRMPVVSLNDARNVVDKLYTYMVTPINADWKNRALMVADDENGGDFMTHSEWMIDAATCTPGAERILWNKVYIDAYEKQNGTYPGARNDMFRSLTEGVVWWNFAGHANPSSWTGDGLMTYTDINNLYLKHFPFVTAATCDFLRWDSGTVSAAEILYRSESSGIIGAVSATRPAYIDSNGMLLKKMGNYMFRTDENGENMTIGEIFRRTKNGDGAEDGRVWNNDNKLRYVLMGDPAMKLCVPSMKIVLDRINGENIVADSQPTLMASQDVSLEGSVLMADGTPAADFDGKIFITLYDAEYSTTSHGYGEFGESVTFEQQGSRLQAIVGSVTDGRFSVKLVMPGEIANNFRPAALNMYAVDPDGRDAIGVHRDLYVYGYDDNAVIDETAPVIESFYLNHESFTSGDVVNPTPVVIARLSDDRSINLSSAGIGHQMLLTIDGRSLTDAPLFYDPNEDGSPSGTLVYQLEKLAAGSHELRLRVWDTSGNSAVETIDFVVDNEARPTVYDLYADCNPASTDTRFYLTHDRPDGLITVNVEVYNMMGKLVWSSSVNGMSDMLRSFPVTWNLTDNAGRRINRGIYLYRASITDNDGVTSNTRTKRIAVTAQ